MLGASIQPTGWMNRGLRDMGTHQDLESSAQPNDSKKPLGRCKAEATS